MTTAPEWMKRFLPESSFVNPCRDLVDPVYHRGYMKAVTDIVEFLRNPRQTCPSHSEPSVQAIQFARAIEREFGGGS